MANLKFKGNVFFPFSYFFFLHSTYSFCNFYFGTKVTFLNILFIELERGERKSNENDDKRKNIFFHRFSATKLTFLGINIFHSMR